MDDRCMCALVDVVVVLFGSTAPVTIITTTSGTT